MQRGKLFLPQEIEPVVAPPPGDLDDQLVLPGAVVRPIVGDDDLLDQVDRIAVMRPRLFEGKGGHRTLLGADRP